MRDNSLNQDPSSSEDDSAVETSSAPSEVSDFDNLTDYRQVYGLSLDPFSAEPEFPFFTGGQRREFLDQLIHLCQFSHGFSLLMGDSGVGKTRLALALSEVMGKSQVCYLAALPTLDSDALANELSNHFGVESRGSLLELGYLLVKIIDEDSAENVRVILIDDAHYLDDTTLIELISVLQVKDFESNGPRVILVGDLSLFGRINRLNLNGLALNDLYLEPFSLKESSDYLNFRMEMADYLGAEMFSENLIESWWRQSQGNLVKLHGYAQRYLLAAVNEPEVVASQKTFPIVHILAVAALVSLILMIWLYRNDKPKDELFVEQRLPFPLHPSLDARSSAQQHEKLDDTLDTFPPVIDIPADSINEKSELPSPVTPEPQEISNSDQKTSHYKIDKPNVAVVPTPPPTAGVEPARRTAESRQPSDPSKQVTAPENVAKNFASNRVFSADEQTLLAWNESDYTVQVLGVSSERAARDYVMAQRNRDDLLIFKTIRQGKDWFVIVSGRYSDSAAARVAIKDLPELQIKENPWVRGLKGVHSDIKK